MSWGDTQLCSLRIFPPYLVRHAYLKPNHPLTISWSTIRSRSPPINLILTWPLEFPCRGPPWRPFWGYLTGVAPKHTCGIPSSFLPPLLGTIHNPVTPSTLSIPEIMGNKQSVEGLQLSLQLKVAAKPFFCQPTLHPWKTPQYSYSVRALTPTPIVLNIQA